MGKLHIHHMDMEMSTESSSYSHLPPGFRFHPTDEELVVHYLKRKAASAPLPVSIIAEIDLYKYDPWELPGKASFGENEWYFFSPRDRKYPNGVRPNRAATSGYWKATGTDKPIRSSAGNKVVGVKKALVFYVGKPPKGVKTNWIMHEYRLVDAGGGGGVGSNAAASRGDRRSRKLSLRLDDWVLCRIYQKQSAHRVVDQDVPSSGPPPLLPFMCSSADLHRPYDDTFFEGLLSSVAKPPELSLILADGNRTLGLSPYYPGDVGGYYHHPVMGAFQIPGVNWST